jgi:3-deoxy-D-arabino-heptulosonate 7-phosphate (DAHP) synthase
MITECLSRKLVIAGPCALESRQQLRSCCSMLQPLGIKAIRASLWKPRTQPGWEGLGAESLDLLLEETIPNGLIPATEILNAEHAKLVVEALKKFGADSKMLVWLGARNQNHIEQRNIAQTLAKGPSNLTFMFKNQMWAEERHWMGIFEHIIDAGYPRERLIACHRGFSPGMVPNLQGLRNLPDFEMAMRLKEKMKIPMVLDPSHIGGSRMNVLNIIKEAQQYHFDGYLIEVHDQPENAKTDVNQQLSVGEFQEVLSIINGEK